MATGSKKFKIYTLIFKNVTLAIKVKTMACKRPVWREKKKKRKMLCKISKRKRTIKTAGRNKTQKAWNTMKSVGSNFQFWLWGEAELPFSLKYKSRQSDRERLQVKGRARSYLKNASKGSQGHGIINSKCRNQRKNKALSRGQLLNEG